MTVKVFSRKTPVPAGAGAGAGDIKPDKKPVELPELELIETELRKAKYGKRYRSVFRSTVYILLVVAAVTVLVATIWLPVLQVYGTSMTPTLDDGDIVLSISEGSFKEGDIIAFYYNNKVLIKRVIGLSGDWVDIDEDGVVSVNGEVLEEPYISEHALGDCNISLPFQVPEGKIFVLGDHRSVSVDSRNKSIGCISEENIVGKLVFRAWPLEQLGAL